MKKDSLRQLKQSSWKSYKTVELSNYSSSRDTTSIGEINLKLFDASVEQRVLFEEVGAVLVQGVFDLLLEGQAGMGNKRNRTRS